MCIHGRKTTGSTIIMLTSLHLVFLILRLFTPSVSYHLGATKIIVGKSEFNCFRTYRLQSTKRMISIHSLVTVVRSHQLLQLSMKMQYSGDNCHIYCAYATRHKAQTATTSVAKKTHCRVPRQPLHC